MLGYCSFLNIFEEIATERNTLNTRSSFFESFTVPMNTRPERWHKKGG